MSFTLHNPGIAYELTCLTQQGIVPATLNLERPDVGVDFNYVPQQSQEKDVRVALSNSFGFGGTNSTLVFSRLE